MVVYADIAKKNKANLGLITTSPGSTIAQLADVAVIIPAPTQKYSWDGILASSQPLGNLYEQCLLLVLDDLIINLMEETKTAPASMRERHTNLE